MKKWLTFLLILFLMIINVVGCESTRENSNASSSNGDTSGEEVAKDQPLKITMTLMGGPKTESSWVEKELEKELNVDFNFIMLPGWEEVKTKINLLMSDPDQMPDVLWWWNDMYKEFQQWVAAGLIVDMMPYLKKHGVNYLKYYGSDVLFYSYQDGKIYRLPGDVAEPSCMTTIIRKDWLDNLGLNIPTTLEEYINVLRAFTYNDPDRNGKDDTYGFSGQAREWRSFAPFLYPFKADPGNFVVTEDGTVKHGSVLPQVKQALKVIQDCYKEGLIDPTILTSNDFNEIFVNGKFGSAYRWILYFNPSNNQMRSFKANNPNGEYIYIEPIKGPDGFSTDEPEDPAGWCYVSITKAAENPEEVFKVLDRLMSPEIFKLQAFGRENEHYRIVDGMMESLVSPEESTSLGLGLLTWISSRKDEANIINTPEVIELFKRREQTSQPMREIRVWFKERTRPKWAEYGADLETLRDEIFYGIITGELPIDEFDRYVEEFYARGGREVEEEANEFYQRQLKEQKEFMEIYKNELMRINN